MILKLKHKSDEIFTVREKKSIDIKWFQFTLENCETKATAAVESVGDFHQFKSRKIIIVDIMTIHKGFALTIVLIMFSQGECWYYIQFNFLKIFFFCFC